MRGTGIGEGSAASLTLEQAASLLSGADFASTKAIPGHDIPSVTMTDGSNGLAMNLPDFSGKVPATCFPSSSAMAATWDPELVARVAAAIATEARAAGAAVLLSPGMNIKRSPLGGRNFEYYSEDPYLTGRIAAAFVRGVQGVGVGACVKHFVANNQETDRMRVSADVSQRALREIYLAAFEHVVAEAKPWLVMASYNRVNGTYVSESRRLLTGILRDEWGFDGVVVSDWGAVEDRVRSLGAGLDLEMPSTSGASDAQIVAAVKAGRLPESVVRESAARVVELARRATLPRSQRDAVADAASLAVEAATSAAVLLSNDGGVLPIPDATSVAVIGSLALEPRIQGAGSAGVNAGPAVSLVDALRRAHSGVVQHAQGYGPDAVTASEDLRGAAIAAAAAADVAIVVAGLPEATESEGYDRIDLHLPDAQVEVITEVARAAKRTVVVLIAGGVVTMEPWRDRVDGILSVGLGGQGLAKAVAALVTGAAAPRGRLAETIPFSLAQTPSYLSFPGEGGHSLYGEGVFVGYRGYDLAEHEVAFPFGHGLSYTAFEFDDARAEADGAAWTATVRVRNTGDRPGREVVQVYVEPPAGAVSRPLRTLAGFASIDLDPGASADVRLRIERRAVERWDEASGGWATDVGTHQFAFGASARDIRLRVPIEVEGRRKVVPLTRDSTLQEWLDHPDAGPRLLSALSAADPSGRTIGMMTNPTAVLMIGGLPIHRLAVDAGNALTEELLDQLAEVLSRTHWSTMTGGPHGRT